MRFGTRFKGKRDNTKYGKRHVAGVMNRTEAEYAGLLELRKKAGEIEEWLFEAVTFKLTGDRCTFTPDFQVLFPDGTMEYVDTKGGGPIDDKSIVKIKVAAEKFPQFQFVVEQKLSKKNAAAHGSSWKRTEY